MLAFGSRHWSLGHWIGQNYDTEHNDIMTNDARQGK
jgi:hypothetical protein